MRIIAGRHRGRNISTIEGNNIRPTTSMVREAIFNILTHGQFREGDHAIIEGAVVADLFCGSGALGLEALSRGAARAIFIDNNNEHLNLARHNAEHLKETAHCRFIRCDSSTPPSSSELCDILFLDPPYGSNLAATALINLAKAGWLKNGSILVIESSKREDFDLPPDFTEISTRLYGITKLVFLKYESSSSQS